MNEILRERIRKINANYDNTEKYLQEHGCHLCEHAIFTNGSPAYSKYVGFINSNYDINSIKWNMEVTG